MVPFRVKLLCLHHCGQRGRLLRIFRQIPVFRSLHLWVLLLFIAASFVTYRRGIVAVPRGDQTEYMMERRFFPSDLSFFKMSVFFNQERNLLPGDYYLFRPAMTGALALVDIAARHNLYIVGALSILWHSLACFLLYMILVDLGLPAAVAFWATGIAVVNYSGMEMIVWRHISPYMLSLICVTWGERLIPDPSAPIKRNLGSWLRPASLFFAACLFHESFALGLLLCGGLLAFSLLGITSGSSRSTSVIASLSCLLPSVCYLILSAFNLAWHQPNELLSAVDKPLAALSFRAVTDNVLTMFGAGFASLFFPFLLPMNPDSFMGRAHWNVEVFPHRIYVVLGLIGMAGILGALLISFRRFRQGQTVRLAFTVLLFGSILAALFGGFALLRMSLRSPDYLSDATYYFYYSVFLGILLSLTLAKMFGLFPSTRSRSSRVLILSAILVIVFNYLEIQKMLTPHEEKTRRMADRILQVASVVQQEKGQCYGGALDYQSRDNVLFELLYRHSCFNRPGIPVYAGDLGDGVLGFYRTKVNQSSVTIYPASETTVPVRGASSDAHRSGETKVYLSSSAFSPGLVRVNLDDIGVGGLIVNYRDEGHYVVADVDNNAFSLAEVVEGKWNQVRQYSFPVPHFKAKSMVVTEYKGRICVLVDDVAIMMEGPYSIPGRLGVYMNKTTVEAALDMKIGVNESVLPSGLFELVFKS